MASLLPLAVVRAVRIARAHPAVGELRVFDDGEGEVILLELDIEQQLPSAWRVTGQSPSGVRAVETATIALPRDYPKRPPRTYLRDDFDRRHPHLLPLPPSERPQPCVVNGYPSELIQARGFEGYLDQLIDWLDKAAMLELNSERHGWEPVRRDHLDDEIVVDSAQLRDMAGPTGECAVVRTDFLKFDLGDGQRHIRIALNLGQSIDLTMAGCVLQEKDDGVSRGQGVALIVSAPDTEGAPTIVGSTMPESVASIDDLIERARFYGCEQAFRAKLDFIGLLVAQQKFVATPLAVVFLVRRPFRLTNSTSSIEICSYVLDLRPGEGLLYSGGGEVRLCGLREEISPTLLQRASGDDETAERGSWVLLGCGSVGSKIAIHMARRGFGPKGVVDRAMMSPHNYARHGLLPRPGVRGGHITFKADALADALAGFQCAAAVGRSSITNLLATPEGRPWFETGGIVLNTTGSGVVRETLVGQEWGKRPTLGEAHLLGAGSVAYSAFEGANGNPSLSDLTTESYRLIAADPAIRDRVFNAKAEAIEIGQGCGALTFPMPDGRLSAFVGGLGETLYKRARFAEPALASGQINLGYLLADGLSQSWRTIEVDPWIAFEIGGCRVRISARVDAMIRRAIAARPGVETGGVIVGRYVQMSETFQIVDLVEAPSDSIFTAARFTLGTVGLRASISRLMRESGGSLYVLGTWHNHLVPSGPSSLDTATAARLALRQFYPVLMLIAHAEGYSGLVTEVAEASDDLTAAPAHTDKGE